MKINLSPTRGDTRHTFTRTGDVMTVGGQAFDFSQLPEGGVLPSSAIQHDAFTGPVKRVGGTLEMTLLLTHGANAPQETLFPQPVRMTTDGVVPLPPYDGEDE